MPVRVLAKLARKRHRLRLERRLAGAFGRPDKGRSLLFFTTHKCASTFVSRLLVDIAAQSPFDAVDYADVQWRLGDGLNCGGATLTDHHDILFRRYNEIYGPLREPLDFPGIAAFPKLFFLRDPRDVLVSWYYSQKVSHSEPPPGPMYARFMAERALAQSETIDAYALRRGQADLAPTFAAYRALHAQTDRSRTVLYPDYARDPMALIGALEDMLDMSLDTATRARLVALATPVQKSVDVTQHQRSGKSGQFIDELAPDTIAMLNTVFAPDLDYWGFSR